MHLTWGLILTLAIYCHHVATVTNGDGASKAEMEGEWFEKSLAHIVSSYGKVAATKFVL